MSPDSAAAWVRAHRPDATIFNPYNWGGYLIWALWPQYQVFVDGRTDLYGDAFLREYLNVQLGQSGFERILSAYGVDLIISYPNDGLAARLACSQEWEQVYRDEVAAIWQRQAISR